MFGRPIAYCSVTETQGRLSLHAHMALWTTLQPQILETVAAFSELQEVVNILDKMFCAKYFAVFLATVHHSNLNTGSLPRFIWRVSATVGTKSLPQDSRSWSQSLHLRAWMSERVVRSTAHKSTRTERPAAREKEPSRAGWLSRLRSWTRLLPWNCSLTKQLQLPTRKPRWCTRY